MLLHCIIIGHLDTVLSEEGNKQAELVGIKMQDEHFTQVFSSDLTRARKVSDYSGNWPGASCLLSFPATNLLSCYCHIFTLLATSLCISQIQE